MGPLVYALLLKTYANAATRAHAGAALSAFKESEHSLTHQREHMTEGIRENLWTCVSEEGGLCIASVCLPVRLFSQTYRFCWSAREGAYARVRGRCTAGSAQPACWQFRSANLTGVLREFLVLTIAKRLSPVIKVVERSKETSQDNPSH